MGTLAEVIIALGGTIVSLAGVIFILLNPQIKLKDELSTLEDRLTYYKIPTIVVEYSELLMPSGYLDEKELEKVKMYYNYDLKEIGKLEDIDGKIQNIRRKLVASVVLMGIILIVTGGLILEIEKGNIPYTIHPVSFQFGIIVGCMITIMVGALIYSLYLIWKVSSNNRRASERLIYLYRELKNEISKAFLRGERSVE